MNHFLTLPDLGIADQPITISMWLAKEGKAVAEGEPMVEVLSGGVTVDLPAPADGVFAEKLVGEDELLTVGQQLARIEAV